MDILGFPYPTPSEPSPASTPSGGAEPGRSFASLLQILRGVLPPHRQDSVVGIDVDATGLEAASEGRSAPVRSGADTNGSPPEMSAQVDAPQEGAVPTEAPVPDPNAAEFDIATASIEADVPGPSVATLDPKNLTAPVSGADPSSGDPGQSPSTREASAITAEELKGRPSAPDESEAGRQRTSEGNPSEDVPDSAAATARPSDASAVRSVHRASSSEAPSLPGTASSEPRSSARLAGSEPPTGHPSEDVATRGESERASAAKPDAAASDSARRGVPPPDDRAAAQAPAVSRAMGETVVTGASRSHGAPDVPPGRRTPATGVSDAPQRDEPNRPSGSTLEGVDRNDSTRPSADASLSMTREGLWNQQRIGRDQGTPPKEFVSLTSPASAPAGTESTAETTEQAAGSAPSANDAAKPLTQTASTPSESAIARERQTEGGAEVRSSRLHATRTAPTDVRSYTSHNIPPSDRIDHAGTAIRGIGAEDAPVSATVDGGAGTKTEAADGAARATAVATETARTETVAHRLEHAARHVLRTLLSALTGDGRHADAASPTSTASAEVPGASVDSRPVQTGASQAAVDGNPTAPSAETAQWAAPTASRTVNASVRPQEGVATPDQASTERTLPSAVTTTPEYHSSSSKPLPNGRDGFSVEHAPPPASVASDSAPDAEARPPVQPSGPADSGALAPDPAPDALEPHQVPAGAEAETDARIDAAPDRMTAARTDATTAASGAARSGGSNASPRAAAAWLNAVVQQPAQFHTEANGTSVLRLRIDEDSGNVTVRSRQEGERMIVSIAFTDAGLQSTAEGQSEEIRGALQQLFDSAVDLSFSRSDQSDHEARRDDGADGLRPTRSNLANAAPEPGERTRTATYHGLTGARYEWVG